MGSEVKSLRENLKEGLGVVVDVGEILDMAVDKLAAATMVFGYIPPSSGLEFNPNEVSGFSWIISEIEQKLLDAIEILDKRDGKLRELLGPFYQIYIPKTEKTKTSD